jgi:outer membrane protein assembly factor BamB
MYSSGHFRVLLLTAAMLLPGSVFVFAQTEPADSQTSSTEVRLHWSPRPGVSRYRLQLASDNAFADIQFDRVVSGHEYKINDLLPGRYFWRIAPLTGRLGEFSSAGIIEVSKPTPLAVATPPPIASAVTDSRRTKTGTAAPILVRGGWRAAVGDIAHPMLAHLRSPSQLDLVGVNSDGVVFALDAADGVAIWSTGRAGSTRLGNGSPMLLLHSSRSGLDDIVLLSGINLTAIEGKTGRALWRATLPTAAASAIAIGDRSSAEILVIDNSLQRLITLDAVNGRLLTQMRLPHRTVGAPLALPGQGAGRVVLVYETGLIEVRDLAGGVVRSGDAGSPATTPPLFIKGPRGRFILVGTRKGLIALTADELNPLGMVAIQDDAPRGTLAAQDLDGDGSPEVIMMTDRGRVVAVSAADGKTLWQATADTEGQSVAFADVDGDRVLDVVLAGGQSFATALSGRDGSVVWRDSESPALVANHSVSLEPRSIVAMPFRSGTLLIAADSSRTGLRALEFLKGSLAPGH